LRGFILVSSYVRPAIPTPTFMLSLYTPPSQLNCPVLILKSTGGAGGSYTIIYAFGTEIVIVW